MDPTKLDTQRAVPGRKAKSTSPTMLAVGVCQEAKAEVIFRSNRANIKLAEFAGILINGMYELGNMEAVFAAGAKRMSNK